MSRRGVAGAVVLALLVAGWAGLAYGSTRPPDHQEYRAVAVEAAQSAHDAVRTARLVGGALLSGDSPGTFAAAVLDDATESLALAAKDVAGEVPPDERAAALRDELLALLAEAVRRLGDVVRAADADDRDALRAAVPALDPVARQLADLLARAG